MLWSLRILFGKKFLVFYLVYKDMKIKNLNIVYITWEIVNNLEVGEGKMEFKRCVGIIRIRGRGKGKMNM